MSYRIAGTIEHIGEVEQVTEKFRKRDLVLRVDGMYPQEIKLEAKQQRTDLLEGLKAFQEVQVDFVLEGRKWEKEGNTQWFNTLTIINIYA